jgi:hypothetical protein
VGDGLAAQQQAGGGAIAWRAGGPEAGHPRALRQLEKGRCRRSGG